jgi:hypothetical protein
MDLLTLLVVILSGIGAIGLKLVSSEIHDWIPIIARRIIDRAVRRLPSSVQERYREELYAHLEEWPGKIGKLFQAAKFHAGTEKLAKSLSVTRGGNADDRGTDIVVSDRVLMTTMDLDEDPESELLLSLHNRFEITIDTKKLSVLVVDHYPTNGEEARDILFFALNKLEDMRAETTKDDNLDWSKATQSISEYISDRIM